MHAGLLAYLTMMNFLYVLMYSHAVKSNFTKCLDLHALLTCTVMQDVLCVDVSHNFQCAVFEKQFYHVYPALLTCTSGHDRQLCCDVKCDLPSIIEHVFRWNIQVYLI